MGKFTFTETGIDGLIVVEPTVFGDNRGYFMETYTRRDYAAGGIDAEFVQDNQSSSHKGVLRGMHMQIENPQGKLVRVIKGEVFDVAVDMRPGSSTFGRWYGVKLSAENKKQLFVPERFAHGFLVLSDEAEFVYKCTRYYAPGDELGFSYDDPAVGIVWPDPGCPIELSDKDRRHPSFEECCRKLGVHAGNGR